MSKHCKDCGTKYSDGMCPNCHEELFIYETQTEFLPEKLSNNFIQKVKQQFILIHKDNQNDR